MSAAPLASDNTNDRPAPTTTHHLVHDNRLAIAKFAMRAILTFCIFTFGMVLVLKSTEQSLQYWGLMMINAAWIAWLSPGKSKLKKPMASIIAPSGPSTGAPPLTTAMTESQVEDSDSGTEEVEALETKRSVKLRSRPKTGHKKQHRHDDT